MGQVKCPHENGWYTVFELDDVLVRACKDCHERRNIQPANPAKSRQPRNR